MQYGAQMRVSGLSQGYNPLLRAGNAFEITPVFGYDGPPIVLQVDNPTYTYTKANTSDVAVDVLALNAPVLNTPSPASLPLAGGTVTLSGTGLFAVQSLTLDGAPLPFEEMSGAVTFTAPAATAAGTASIQVTTPAGTATTNLTYTGTSDPAVSDPGTSKPPAANVAPAATTTPASPQTGDAGPAPWALAAVLSLGALCAMLHIRRKAGRVN